MFLKQVLIPEDRGDEDWKHYKEMLNAVIVTAFILMDIYFALAGLQSSHPLMFLTAILSMVMLLALIRWLTFRGYVYLTGIFLLIFCTIGVAVLAIQNGAEQFFPLTDSYLSLWL